MVSSGVYAVKEDGLVFQHDTSQAAIEADEPTTPEIFIQRFNKNFKLNILERPDDDHLVVEFINVDVSFVNALRRILIAEIPTVAIENVYMFNNNGIIHDEVLAHRLGLIPLKIDPRYLEDFPTVDEALLQQQQQQQASGNNNNKNQEQEEEEAIATPMPTDRNTIVFQLVVSCNKDDEKKDNETTGGHDGDNKEDDDDADDDEMERLAREEEKTSVIDNPDVEEVAKAATAASAKKKKMNTTKLPYASDRPYTKHVYSRDLKWLPQGNQEIIFGGSTGTSTVQDDNDDDDTNTNKLPVVRPIHDDILIAKLRPGQTIELEAFAQRGIGSDHAKYSPVCTASYRLMPQISIVKPIYDKDAEELVYIYEPGVFTLVPCNHQTTGTNGNDGGDPIHTKVKAVLCNPYACTMSRNYMRNPVLAESIQMNRLSNHFIFSIESIGQYPSPGVLLAEAIRVLQRKCQNVIDLIDEHTMKTEI